MKSQSIKRNRRYYLHRLLKGIYKVQAKKRTVQIPAGEPIQKPKVINELISAGYNIQTYIK